MFDHIFNFLINIFATSGLVFLFYIFVLKVFIIVIFLIVHLIKNVK